MNKTKKNSVKIFFKGDPTIFGNFPPPQSAVDSIIEAVKSGTKNGYGPSNGSKEAREAVANFTSEENAAVTPNVIMLLTDLVKKTKA